MVVVVVAETAVDMVKVILVDMAVIGVVAMVATMAVEGGLAANVELDKIKCNKTTQC